MQPEQYKEVEPPESLRSFVRRIVYSDFAEGDSLCVPAPPTGYQYIQWVARGELDAIGSEVPGLMKQGDVAVAGQMYKIEAVMDVTGPLRHLVAELSCPGLHSLTGLYGKDLRNKNIVLHPGGPFYATGFATLKSKHWATAPMEEVVRVFISTIEGLAASPHSVPDYIAEGGRLVEQRAGNVTLSEMAGELSERHYSRQFNKYVGVPPKYFAQVVRINTALAQLLSAKHGNLTKVATDAGYADQSHLIKSVRAFFKYCPSELKDQINEVLTMFPMRSQSIESE